MELIRVVVCNPKEVETEPLVMVNPWRVLARRTAGEGWVEKDHFANERAALEDARADEVVICLDLSDIQVLRRP